MIKFEAKGDYSDTRNFLTKIKEHFFYKNLSALAEEGVQALANATPKDTGLTANSWTYEIIQSDQSIKIIWKNTNINKGIPIAFLIQYGHGTRNGGYVPGIDYINPAMQPIFQKIEDYVMNEVSTK